MVIAGELDKVETIERIQTEVVGKIPSEITVVRGSGHILPIEATKQVSELIQNFLYQHSTLSTSEDRLNNV